jgi:hypothetical protein
MKQPTMVYRSPATKISTTCVDRATGKTYEHQVIDADEEGAVEAALAAGWYGSPKEAIAAGDKVPEAPRVDPNAPPTRAELETKANELGVVFDADTDDLLLGLMIEEAIETRGQDMGEFL